MSDRITPRWSPARRSNDINSALTALERSSTELSSGKTILEPSDNPYGASRVDRPAEPARRPQLLRDQRPGRDLLGEHGERRDGEHEQRAPARARTAACRPPTAPTTRATCNSIAAEVEQLTEAVKQDANTQYAGQYVFSGTLTTTAPYAAGAKTTLPGQRRNDRARDRARARR